MSGKETHHDGPSTHPLTPLPANPARPPRGTGRGVRRHGALSRRARGGRGDGAADRAVQDRHGTSADEAEPWFKIVNNSGSAVSLSQVTLRYYFSADTAGSYVFACAWAVVGCSTITGTIAPLGHPTATADHYLQIGFTGGSIAPGADTGDIQLRMYRADWQNVDQANDYSLMWTRRPTGPTRT